MGHKQLPSVVRWHTPENNPNEFSDASRITILFLGSVRQMLKGAVCTQCLGSNV